MPQRLADRLTGHRDLAAPAEAERTFRLVDMVRPPINWTLLGEEPGVEMVVGQIGRPWQPTDMGSGPDVAPAAFAAFASFDQRGFAKIALSLRVQPYGATCTILTMETRVAVIDPVSLRRFRRYWAFIGPFSHLVRWIAMHMVAADLHRDIQDAFNCPSVCQPSAAAAPEPLPVHTGAHDRHVTPPCRFPRDHRLLSGTR